MELSRARVFSHKDCAALQRVHVCLGCQLHHAGVAADASQAHSFPAFPFGSGIVCCYLREFFYRPLHSRSALAIGGLCAFIVPPNAGQFHRPQESAAHAAGAFISSDRLLHLGSGKYRHVFWSVAVSASEAAMGHCRSHQDQFLDAPGDHQLHHRGGIERDFSQTAGSIFCE